MLIMSSLVVRGGLQGVGLLLAASLLGPAGYGSVVGLSALTVLLAQVAAPGVGEVMLRAVVRGQDGRAAVWRAQFILLLLGSTICVALVMAQIGLSFAPSLGFVVLIAMSDILAMRSLDLVQFHQQSVDSERGVAVIQVITGLARPVAAGIFYITGGGLEGYAVAYALAASCAAAAGLFVLVRRVGPPTLECTRDIGSMICAGGPFIGASLARSFVEIDRFVLERLAGPAAAGVYGLAMRAVEYAGIPSRAILMKAYGSFFVIGDLGPGQVRDRVRDQVRRLVPKTLLSGLFGSAIVLLGVPVLPRLLGPAWADVGTCMLILAPLPVLRAIQNLFGDAMSGSDKQTLRMLLMWLVAVVQIGFVVVVLDGAQDAWATASWVALVAGGCLTALMLVCGRGVTATEAVR